MRALILSTLILAGALAAGSRAPLPEPSPLRTGHGDCSSSGSSLGRFILAARNIRSWIRPTTASVAVQSTLDVGIIVLWRVHARRDRPHAHRLGREWAQEVARVRLDPKPAVVVLRA